MSAPITGQTITFEQISETLRTQYSDAEKRLQDSNKTQVDPMRLNKNPKSLDNDIRARDVYKRQVIHSVWWMTPTNSQPAHHHR